MQGLPIANRTVLIVVEEPAIRELLSVNLRQAGCFPVQAASAADGHRLVNEVRPDAIVIDLDSPATANGSFAKGIRYGDLAGTVPTVMVTARVDEVCGLEREVCGATLCISKPYAPRELVGRILQMFRAKRRQARRRPKPQPKILRIGELTLDSGRQAATRRLPDGRVKGASLAPVEMKLLRCLMENAERTLTRDEIVESVWGNGSPVDGRTVDQCIKRLRVALALIDLADLVQTARGFGYRFDAMQIQRGVAVEQRAPLRA